MHSYISTENYLVILRFVMRFCVRFTKPKFHVFCIIIAILVLAVKLTMITFADIVQTFSGKNIPPIMRGTKVMIKQIAREERRIAEMNKLAAEKQYSMIRPKENLSEIFTKYVNKDFNKDAYLFIK